MKILALQLKRIGDLVLTTPALRALRASLPEAHVTLAVMDGTAALLPAIATAEAAIVFGKERGFAPWQQVLGGGWDVCLDFTGNDRSALAAALSRAKVCATFSAGRRKAWRAIAYNRWADSAVREVHTAQHYLDLVTLALPCERALALDLTPALTLPGEPEMGGNYALLHPGTARREKYWIAERWREVAAHLINAHGLEAIVSCGPDAFERAHAEEIARAGECSSQPAPKSTFDHSSCKPRIEHPPDLLALARLVAGARIVVSCDTAVVHLAAAFQRPQIALFGPTNPFHWRPLHDRAMVLSAAFPEAPLTGFSPRMRGAPMDRISTALVIHAVDSLLATNLPSRAEP